ncbi:MAG: monofunctional biosynthetic peptidoglycan transglycosylase [Henriciella sp.]|nr:monofunctional biosynthetic peptidoglycan transglycosylase [Henriciella sp.]MBO6695676.1 monofunctional biosynthetic peptidoglycan transglycosylase [Henriciella sp.]
MKIGTWVWRATKLAVACVVAVHVYALALIFVPVPGTLNMSGRIVQGTDVYYSWTRAEEISPHLVRAVIAAEDTRFCEHAGVDLDAIRTALDERQESGRVRGASTLTQQTAKNVFLWNGGGYARKGAEAWMAVFIDGFWGKRRVMEAYLNVAEWGDGLYGAEAAAFGRFGKPARDLTRFEAARLAAVLPSPNKWRVNPAGPYVRQRTQTILARMDVVARDGLDDCVLD